MEYFDHNTMIPIDINFGDDLTEKEKTNLKNYLYETIEIGLEKNTNSNNEKIYYISLHLLGMEFNFIKTQKEITEEIQDSAYLFDYQYNEKEKRYIIDWE